VLINQSAAIGSVSPNSLTFSNQRVNTTSATKRIPLLNKGNYQMTVSQFLITGDFQTRCPSPTQPRGKFVPSPDPSATPSCSNLAPKLSSCFCNRTTFGLRVA
jgi:hypothetical protein